MQTQVFAEQATPLVRRDREEFSEQLLKTRTQRGLTRSDLSRFSGVAETTIYRIETGRTTASRGTCRLLLLALEATK